MIKESDIPFLWICDWWGAAQDGQFSWDIMRHYISGARNMAAKELRPDLDTLYDLALQFWDESRGIAHIGSQQTRTG